MSNLYEAAEMATPWVPNLSNTASLQLFRDAQEVVGTLGGQWRVKTESHTDHLFFNRDEWALTVLLKRKPRKLRVGDLVRPKVSPNGAFLVVDAVSESSGALECWVLFPDGSHTTYEATDLTLAISEG